MASSSSAICYFEFSVTPKYDKDIPIEMRLFFGGDSVQDR